MCSELGVRPLGIYLAGSDTCPAVGAHWAGAFYRMCPGRAGMDVYHHHAQSQSELDRVRFFMNPAI